MITVKDYHIEMLSVGAADAFILYVIDAQDEEQLGMMSGIYINLIVNYVCWYSMRLSALRLPYEHR